MIRSLEDTEDANRAKALSEPSQFEPPYTTLHCGLVSGGTSPTTVAEGATFTVDIRAIPSERPEHYVDQFRVAAREFGNDNDAAFEAAKRVEIDIVTNLPGLRPEEGGAAERLASRLCAVGPTGMVSYGTEAGLYQSAGWSTVVCGPGDILQGHKADEFIELSELAAGGEMLARLVNELS
jgi:acetylornithine deacetylase